MACGCDRRSVFEDGTYKIDSFEIVGVFVFGEGFDLIAAVDLGGVGGDPVLASAIVVECKLFADQFEVADVMVADGAVAPSDHSESSICELEGADAGVLDRIIGLVGVAEVSDNAAGGCNLAAKVTGQVVEVDDLFENLSAGFVLVAPPGGSLHVGPVAAGKKGGPAGLSRFQ